jgi:hypothetical protein
MGHHWDGRWPGDCHASASLGSDNRHADKNACRYRLHGAAVRWGHGVRGHRRQRLGMRGHSLTQGAMRLVRQPIEGSGLVGARVWA